MLILMHFSYQSLNWQWKQKKSQCFDKLLKITIHRQYLARGWGRLICRHSRWTVGEIVLRPISGVMCVFAKNISLLVCTCILVWMEHGTEKFIIGNLYNIIWGWCSVILFWLTGELTYVIRSFSSFSTEKSKFLMLL